MSLQRRTPLRATTPLKRTTQLARTQTPAKRRSISPATKAQRDAAAFCIVTGARRDEGWIIDPAHLAARGGHGGCDDPRCTVGLRRDIHEAFDRGEVDLLPYLIAHQRVAELQHALEHYHGDLLGLAARLCGESGWVPERRVA